MKLVEWTDEVGWKHLALLRDGDPDDMATQGISRDPPDINQLNWDEIKRDLHNELVNRRLSDWRDVQKRQGDLTGAVQAVLRRRLKLLYNISYNKTKEVTNG